jgi:uncharacterized protein YdbL (DUF1318 family)
MRSSFLRGLLALGLTTASVQNDDPIQALKDTLGGDQQNGGLQDVLGNGRSSRAMMRNNLQRRVTYERAAMQGRKSIPVVHEN